MFLATTEAVTARHTSEAPLARLVYMTLRNVLNLETLMNEPWVRRYDASPAIVSRIRVSLA